MALKTFSKDVSTRKNGKLKKESKRSPIQSSFKEKFESKLGYPIQFVPQFLWQGADTSAYFPVSSVHSHITESMAAYFPPYNLQPNSSYPVIVNEWGPMVGQMQTASSLYTGPVPMVVTPKVLTPICPYTGALVAEPMLASIIPNPMMTDVLPLSNPYKAMIGYSTEHPSASDAEKHHSYSINSSVTEPNTAEDRSDPLEFYLTLPRELFPPARMFALDPNPIIDEFCKLINIGDHAPWILDLEFGIPRVPNTRPIPVYDVQFNSIHCRNTPGAIHPGFESCTYNFKRIFLFYYDCIISTWYKGYIITKRDKSVENFESWLSLPMQIFGMCWP